MLFALVFGQSAFAQLGVMTSTDDVHYDYYISYLGNSTTSDATKGYVGLTSDEATEFSAGATLSQAVVFRFKSSGDSNLPYALYYVKDGVEYPVVFNSSNFIFYAESGDAVNIALGTPTTVSNSGHGMYQYWGVNILSKKNGTNTYRWNTNSSRIKEDGQNANTDGRPYWLWRMVPASPAPMVFSSTYCTYSTAVAATIPDGVTAYAASLSDDVVTLTQIEGTIPAYVGVILSNGGSATVYQPTASSEEVTVSSDLTPTCKSGVVDIQGGSTPTYSNTGYFSVTNSSNIYGLGSYTDSESNETVQAFLPFSETGTITMPAYKAYLNTSTDALAIKLQFPDGSTTNINGVNVEHPTNNAAIYDLSGRRVNATAKGGLYIQNGKKFIAE